MCLKRKLTKLDAYKVIHILAVYQLDFEIFMTKSFIKISSCQFEKKVGKCPEPS